MSDFALPNKPGLPARTAAKAYVEETSGRLCVNWSRARERPLRQVRAL